MPPPTTHHDDEPLDTACRAVSGMVTEALESAARLHRDGYHGTAAVVLSRAVREADALTCDDHHCDDCVGTRGRAADARASLLRAAS